MMPYCCAGTRLATADNGVKLFYRTYGHGPTKVLLVIGLAGTHESWRPQIEGLAGTFTPNNHETDSVGSSSPEERYGCSYQSSYRGIQVCAFDNRGVGRSSVPTNKADYTSKIMAKEAISLLDHLGWRKAHVFGHSMGAMIACKLAAMVPDRVLSLALLNVTGGGLECFPKFDRQTLSIAYRFLKAKTPEERAAVDLETHYTKEYLEEYVGTSKRRTILFQQYVKGISATGMQSNSGFEGQVNACWTHKITQTEVELIKSGGFPIAVIHGRHDIIAQLYYARRLAERLQPMARMVDLHGGHLVSHERREEVNQALLDLIKASGLKMNAHDWSHLPKKNSRAEKKLLVFKTDIQVGSNVSFVSRLEEKLHLCLFYLFDLLVLPIESGRKLLGSLKPVRVGSSPSYVYQ